MTYNSDIRLINQLVKKQMKENLEPSIEEIINWCKLSYIQGRIAMGEDPKEYVIAE